MNEELGKANQLLETTLAELKEFRESDHQNKEHIKEMNDIMQQIDEVKQAMDVQNQLLEEKKKGLETELQETRD